MIKKIENIFYDDKKCRVFRSYCYRLMTITIVILLFLNIISGIQTGTEHKQIVFDTCMYLFLIFDSLIFSFVAEYDIMNGYINQTESAVEVRIPIECDPDEI